MRSLWPAGPPVLEPLPAQYVDIVAAEQRRYSGGLLDQQLAFWRKELDGLPAALQLRSIVRVHRSRPFAATASLRALADDVSPRVGKAFGRELGATPLRGAAIRVPRIAASLRAAVDDLAVGTAVLNRLHPDSAGSSVFANNIVLRATSPEQSDSTRTRRADAIRPASALHGTPGKSLSTGWSTHLVASRVKTDHSPLFQVMFVLRGGHGRAWLPGAVGDCLFQKREPHRYDLAVDLYDTDTGLQASFEHNKDLFDAATILA